MEKRGTSHYEKDISSSSSSSRSRHRRCVYSQSTHTLFGFRMRVYTHIYILECERATSRRSKCYFTHHDGGGADVTVRVRVSPGSSHPAQAPASEIRSRHGLLETNSCSDFTLQSSHGHYNHRRPPTTNGGSTAPM
ncbi:uncharacterized protein LOC125764846 [Anopheles funestus]|uniref:uncharacterized protein LOC125764846 n=1 Tax=Anopheles funestus TaxID=62324 RepID=UPI0020C6691C|nr:uncharacterized protein LOC125764846 [Anopheles funestus]